MLNLSLITSFALVVLATLVGQTDFANAQEGISMKIADVLKKKWIVDHQQVLLPGEPEDWDGMAVHTPIVFKDGDVYRMYYTGRSMRGDWCIGTATSTDLFHWTKHPKPVLTSGEYWDVVDFSWAIVHDFPWTIKVDNNYYMFFETKFFAKENPKSESDSKPESETEDPESMTIRGMHTTRFGLAVSNDGLHFHKLPRIPLAPDPNGTWDKDGLFAPRVYRRGDKFWMFYGGSDGKVARSGLAFSTDLINWERYEHNPIIDVGAPGDWDYLSTVFGSVIELEDGYLGAYEGEDRKKMQIGLAYSKDLKQWTKFEGNPIVRTKKSYVKDGIFVCAAHLIIHQGKLYLFYTHNIPSGGKFSHIEVARLE